MPKVLPLIPEDDPLIMRLLNYMKHNFYTILYRFLILIAIFLVGYLTIILISGYNRFSADYQVNFELPFKNWIVIEPRTSEAKVLFKRAKAAPPTFEDKIREAFGSHADTFLEIAKMESGQNAGVKGYNCFYYNAKGERYSTSCKPDDRSKAWSVDCGALQVNVYGKVCPVEMFDLDKNLEAAVGKFKRQGFKAWSVCNQKKVKCV